MQPEFNTYNGMAYYSPEFILSHPEFRLARERQIQGDLELFEYNPFLSRLMMEGARATLFGVIMCLSAGHDEADRSTWPTLGKLLKSLEPFQLASPRRLEALVSRLVQIGYIVAVPSDRDRRVRILTPGEKMLTHDQEWLRIHYEPLEVLFPDPGYGLATHRNRAFQFAQRLMGMQLAPEVARLMATSPEIMVFFARDAGILVLMKLLQYLSSAPDGRNESMSFAELGERCGVSRTHVRLMLRDAEAVGLVRISGRGGQRVELMPLLIDAFDRFVAGSMSLHDLCYRLAVRHLGGG